MTKFKISITLIFLLVFIIDSFGQIYDTSKKGRAEVQQHISNQAVATKRDDDVIISVKEIITQNWNTSVCLEDPDNNSLYEGELGFDDVNKLLTEPYTTDDASFNPLISNHTFWFWFGCCGVEEAFCADDNFRVNVHTDDFYEVGSLKMADVEVAYETTVWVDFLTQCENCSGGGEGGMGVWHKDEKEYIEDELAFANTFGDIQFSVSPRYIMSVPCQDDGSIYGCENGELND